MKLATPDTEKAMPKMLLQIQFLEPKYRVKGSMEIAREMKFNLVIYNGTSLVMKMRLNLNL